MYTADASFFARFDALGVEAHALAGARAALDNSTRMRDQARAQLHEARSELARTESYASEQRSRIDLVSSHWFFGTTVLQPQLWMRGGTEGKISRAQAKLDKCEKEIPVQAEKVKVLEEQTLPPLEQAVVQHTNAHARKTALDAERTAMMEGAIAAHPSAPLVQLQGQEAALAQQIAMDQQQAAALAQIGSMCIDGRRHYERARTLTREAMALNNAAAAEHNPNRRVSCRSGSCRQQRPDRKGCKRFGDECRHDSHHDSSVCLGGRRAAVHPPL